MRPVLVVLLGTSLVACSGDVYVRDGVTDGDTFYLAPRAFYDTDPALQSWVRYSLMKTTCQLTLEAKIPSRASSYDCELSARRALVEAWGERTPAAAADPYLDMLALVHDAGYLDEYTAHYFGRRQWVLPPDLKTRAFAAWRKRHLRGHQPQTLLVGSWNYGRRQAAGPLEPIS